MGKFDGILMCTDLDDTILTHDKKISAGNIEAVKYFMSEGGKFSFATGRVPRGVAPILEYIMPNAPMVCFNGGSIYDIRAKKELWSAQLPAEAGEVVDYVTARLPFAGVEVCTEKNIYFCKRNDRVNKHQLIENFPDNDMHYREIPEPWRKVLFMTEADEVEAVRSCIAESPYADTYSYVKSSPWYYEILPKDCTKGAGLLRLADIMGIARKNTVGAGDNENDLELVRKAGTGIAVANASEMIKAEADRVTKADNDHDAIAEIIYEMLD